ncbi:MAG TPA: hypothetical protein H9774_05675 [Candidatus Desulfovibrio gallistercoris]|nr:hypothetical protein [Candidatus Desulfovibrio gallistercoris]
MPRRVPATAGQPLTSAVRWPVRDRDMAVATDRAEVKAADKNADRDTDRDVVKADMAAAKGRHDVTLSALRTGKALHHRGKQTQGRLPRHIAFSSLEESALGEGVGAWGRGNPLSR